MQVIRNLDQLATPQVEWACSWNPSVGHHRFSRIKSGNRLAAADGMAKCRISVVHLCIEQLIWLRDARQVFWVDRSLFPYTLYAVISLWMKYCGLWALKPIAISFCEAMVQPFCTKDIWFCTEMFCMIYQGIRPVYFCPWRLPLYCNFLDDLSGDCVGVVHSMTFCSRCLPVVNCMIYYLFWFAFWWRWFQ